MKYTPTVWIDDNEPSICADNLNKLERGLEAVSKDVTTESSGLMSAEDKKKLDSIVAVTAPVVEFTEPADAEQIEDGFNALIQALKDAGVLK